MTKEQLDILVKLVRQEADNIKLHATPEENSKLNFRLLKSTERRKCVYGQMTGDCYSYRANDLIRLCALKVYAGDMGICMELIYHLNGSPKDIDLGSPHDRVVKYHSPIELFIYLMEWTSNEFANKMLLEYIQGKRKTFKPKFENSLVELT